MKDGRFYNYQLTVIDRHTGMHSWIRKHRNDTRYVTPEDTHNIFLNGTKNQQLWIRPEIRVDKVFEANLFDTMAKNLTGTTGADGKLFDATDLSVVDVVATVFRSKKWLMLLDSNGYITYFVTR